MEKTKLGVIGGCGHIGLVQAVGLASLGYATVAYDIDLAAIRGLEKGMLPFFEPRLKELLHRTMEKKLLSFTGQISPLRQADIIYICVGTPALPDGTTDTLPVESAVEMAARTVNEPAVVVLKSTVPVGTARRLSRRLAEKGLDQKVTVVSNPEFLAEGTAVKDFFRPSRIIVGGEDEKSMAKVASLHAPPGTALLITTWENAEFIKYASNAFLAAKLSFINELSALSEEVGADIRIVGRGMGLDERIGTLYLEAGVGFSGPCLEKDLRSLIKQFHRAGVEAPLLEVVLEVNRRQRQELVWKLEEKLGDLKAKKIGVLGFAFKPGTDDFRDSHSIPIIKHLLSLGARVTVHDPLVAYSREKGRFAEELPGLTWASSPYSAAQGKDGLLILTAWPEYRELDLEKLKKCLAFPVIIDGRNLFDPEQMQRLQIHYRGVGI